MYRKSTHSTARRVLVGALVGAAITMLAAGTVLADLGDEVAIPRHLRNGKEFQVGLGRLVEHGADLFNANWTVQEGGFRPMTKGTGAPLADPTSPLLFPRNINRISAPDANSCGGCHNVPRSGGGGDMVANVFVLGQRFDFATFDNVDGIPTRGGVDENGVPVLLQTIANSRNTLGMFGSGYTEMIARQMTADMQAIRDSIAPGGSEVLETTGVDFGVLSRDAAGNWDTSAVEGLPPMSLASDGPDAPPSLVIHPFHQASAVVSLRQFTNNAFNHHHGIQTEERFGTGVDFDDDGFVNEMTIADVTAASIYQATLAVPGRVIPNDVEIEQAVLDGEDAFVAIGCDRCHTPVLHLRDGGEMFVEPNPFNPPGNLQNGEYDDFVVNLNSKSMPLPRLVKDPSTDMTAVPLFSDMKLHDITTGPDDPNCEALNMHHPGGSADFVGGNCRFLTKRLWGAANEPPFFHHGAYFTMREAIEAHAGEAADEAAAWAALSDYERDAIIEFLKTLQVLDPGVESLVVDENNNPKDWPPFPGV